jgi:hypothetical protein
VPRAILYGGSLHLLPLIEQLQTERAHRRQFPLKLAIGFLGRKRVEQVRQLDAMAHDLISHALLEPLA